MDQNLEQKLIQNENVQADAFFHFILQVLNHGSTNENRQHLATQIQSAQRNKANAELILATYLQVMAEVVHANRIDEETINIHIRLRSARNSHPSLMRGTFKARIKRRARDGINTEDECFGSDIENEDGNRRLLE